MLVRMDNSSIGGVLLNWERITNLASRDKDYKLVYIICGWYPANGSSASSQKITRNGTAVDWDITDGTSDRSFISVVCLEDLKQNETISTNIPNMYAAIVIGIN